jgi:CRP-like cAMP-binding protein
LVRLYSLAEDGEEHNHGFHGAGEWVHGRLVRGAEAGCCDAVAVGVEALQPTRATTFQFAELEAWAKGDPELSGYLMERLMAMNAARLGHEAALVRQSAEQRYLALLRRQPDLLGKVKLQDVARWLGITPIALSRIRRRLRERIPRP